MKIALCLEYLIDQRGGTEILVTELIKGLGARHEILLVSPDDAASLAKSPVAPFVQEHISISPVWNSISAARGLVEKIARAKPDVVQFHFGGNYGWGNRAFWRCPVFQLRNSGVPVISANFGAFSIFEGYCGERRKLLKLALFLPAWLSKQTVLAQVRCETAVSQNDLQNLRRWYPLLRGKFRRIYGSRLHGTPPPENPGRKKTILCAGTIGPRKGQPLLAEAFARVAKNFPDWQLVFIGRSGDADSLGQIQKTVAREKIESQVRLLGARSDDELRDWLQQSAIFAMPSVYEGLGLSLQEAQFYGCACVSTRSGGVADLITDGDNGLLVPVGQAAPLADALARLMGDAALRQRFSRRGPQSVLEKSMTAPQMVQKYEELYAEVLRCNS